MGLIDSSLSVPDNFIVLSDVKSELAMDMGCCSTIGGPVSNDSILELGSTIDWENVAANDKSIEIKYSIQALE